MASFVLLSPSSERGFARNTEPSERNIQKNEARKGRRKQEKSSWILKNLERESLPLSTNSRVPFEGSALVRRSSESKQVILGCET